MVVKSYPPFESGNPHAAVGSLTKVTFARARTAVVGVIAPQAAVAGRDPHTGGAMAHYPCREISCTCKHTKGIENQVMSLVIKIILGLLILCEVAKRREGGLVGLTLLVKLLKVDGVEEW